MSYACRSTHAPRQVARGLRATRSRFKPAPPPQACDARLAAAGRATRQGDGGGGPVTRVWVWRGRRKRWTARDGVWACRPGRTAASQPLHERRIDPSASAAPPHACAWPLWGGRWTTSISWPFKAALGLSKPGILPGATHLAGYPIPGCLPGILPQPRQGRRTHTDTQRLISRRKQPVGGQLADGQGDTHLTLAGPGSGKARRTRPCRRRSFSSDSLGGVF